MSQLERIENVEKLIAVKRIPILDSITTIYGSSRLLNLVFVVTLTKRKLANLKHQFPLYMIFFY